jgi:hypothetical protein
MMSSPGDAEAIDRQWGQYTGHNCRQPRWEEAKREQVHKSTDGYLVITVHNRPCAHMYMHGYNNTPDMAGYNRSKLETFPNLGSMAQWVNFPTPTGWSWVRILSGALFAFVSFHNWLWPPITVLHNRL